MERVNDTRAWTLPGELRLLVLRWREEQDGLHCTRPVALLTLAQALATEVVHAETCTRSGGCGARDAAPAGIAGVPRRRPHPYAFNAFSHNSQVDAATGYNEEETKIIRETGKIFSDEEVRVTATCVRIPVLRAHCVAINFECEAPISAAEVRQIVQQAPGVKIVDDPERNRFPMPQDATGQDAILVGRIRQDPSDPGGRSVAMFVAGDQLLKGAALNAVQIAELLVRPPGG